MASDPFSLMHTLFKRIQASPTIRKFAAPIDSTQINGVQAKPRAFTRDEAYFQVRLAEMYLKDGRKYWRDFLPVAVCVTGFAFEGKQQEVPFIVSNDLLKAIDTYADGSRIEFRNTKLTPPIPYVGGGLSLFVGLYRTVRTDYSLIFFNFMGGVVKAFDMSGLSRYLDLAKPLSAGIEQFLGMTNVEFVLGTRQEFSDTPAASPRFEEGYWAFINSPEKSVNKDGLWVLDGRLMIEQNERKQHFDDSDYCLVQIDYLEERGDYTTLPFHSTWNDAKKLIWDGETDKAKAKFRQLAQEIAVSADLTPKHRVSLMLVYKANFEKQLEMYQSQFLDAQSISPTRSDDGVLTPKASHSIDRLGIVVENAGLPQNIIDGVYSLKELLRTIVKPDLTDHQLSSQLKRVEGTIANDGSDPGKLANALVFASFDT